jgi:hypothetical protein
MRFFQRRINWMYLVYFLLALAFVAIAKMMGAGE